MAKGYELEGQMKVIEEIKEFSSGFTKREFVVEAQDGQYSQMIKFELVKDKTGLADDYKVGDDVKVFFDIRGNEYNGKYYVNLNAWKLEKPGGDSPAPAGPAAGAGAGAGDEDAPPAELNEPPPGYGEESSDDDIPF